MIKLIVFLFLIFSSLTLMSCEETAKSAKTDECHGNGSKSCDDSDDDNVGIPDYAIRDIFEYVNTAGNCPTTWFGDSNNGCVKYMQLTRFNDGTAYFSCLLGSSTTTTWSWSKYVRPVDSRFTEELYLGGTVKFRLEANLLNDVPTMVMYYDHTNNYADTPSHTIQLQEIQ